MYIINAGILFLVFFNKPLHLVLLDPNSIKCIQQLLNSRIGFQVFLYLGLDLSILLLIFGIYSPLLLYGLYFSLIALDASYT